MVRWMENSVRVEDWLAARCESDKTKDSYLFLFGTFVDFCNVRYGKDALKVVDDWRTARGLSSKKRECWLEEWQDIIRSYNTWMRPPKYAPMTCKNLLTALKSFLGYWKIPLDVDLPRHSAVMYHNRDLTREEIKKVLNFSSQRDRTILLVLIESGMRVENAVGLKYSQIREDFEAHRVPMRILLPSNTLKDTVGERWTFVGEDGFNELSNYLQGKQLKDDEFVFQSERKGRVKGEQFSPGSVSQKFNNLVQKLGIDKSVTGKLKEGERPKPKRIRLHGLRKYFRNNMRAEESFREFWMGHSLGVDAHYISRDPEEHRKRYADGYKYLRLFQPSLETLGDVTMQLRTKDEEIKALKESVAKLQTTVDTMLQGLMEKDKQYFKKRAELSEILKELEK
jgi:integrase